MMNVANVGNGYAAMTDEELVAVYRETGDQYAFSVLYKRYARIIHNKAHATQRNTNGRVVAEDLISKMNEGFYCAVSVYRLDSTQSFGSLVFTINWRSEAYGIRHSADKKRTMIDDVDPFKETNLRGSYELDYDPIGEQLGHLEAASPDLRKIAVLRLQGYTCEEIGRIYADGSTGTKAKLRMAGKRRVDNVAKHLVTFYKKHNPRALIGYSLQV